MPLGDENTDTNGLCDNGRIYYLADANMNVTSLVDINGDALERYIYDPLGRLTIYEATWSNIRSASSYSNYVLFTGRHLDPETGLYYYHRYYSAELGRFVSRDQWGMTPTTRTCIVTSAITQWALQTQMAQLSVELFFNRAEQHRAAVKRSVSEANCHSSTGAICGISWQATDSGVTLESTTTVHRQGSGWLNACQVRCNPWDAIAMTNANVSLVVWWGALDSHGVLILGKHRHNERPTRHTWNSRHFKCGFWASWSG